MDPDTGRKLRAILDDPGRSTVDTSARTYLLAGMIRCGLCGAQLHARPVIRTKNEKKYRYRRYGCWVDKGGCNKVGIGAQPLEDLVVEAVLQRLDTEALSEAVSVREGELSIPDIADIEQRLDDLAEMFSAGEITRSEWVTARTGLTRRLDDARSAEAASLLSAATAQQVARPDVLRAEWPELSLEKRRLLLAAVIDHIVIAPTTRAGNKFNPGRVDIVWTN
jgi:hypothetical protein